MHLVPATFFAFVFMLLAVFQPAQAASLGDDSHLQLKHVMASVQSKPGGYTTQIRPLTPILTVPKAEDTAFVCQRAPRAAEAVLNYFMKNPAPVDKHRNLDIDALKKQAKDIAAYVNKAFGRDVVSEVYIIEGGKTMGSGVMSRLPFAQTQGCGRVMEEYETRMNQLLGGEKK